MNDFDPKTQVVCEKAWLEGLLKEAEMTEEKLDMQFYGTCVPLVKLFGYIDSAKVILNNAGGVSASN